MCPAADSTGGSARATFTRWLALLLGIVLATLMLGACATPPVPITPIAGSISPAATGMPATTLTVVTDKLSAANILFVAPDQTLVFIAGQQIATINPQGQHGNIAVDLPDLDSGAAPLLDLALSPTFPADAHAYACYRTASDIRVAQLGIDRELTTITTNTELITGIPRPASSPGTCRLAFGPDGYLYVGTADADNPRAPQDLASLGGKILRIDTATRRPPASNPFADRPDALTRLIYSYGHREITGLTWHPVSGLLYAMERGPGREDEINVIVPGGNYGWNPAAKSAFTYQTDGVPMTDLTIANARPAAWSSGNNVAGLGPGIFVQGSQWGLLSGNLAITSTTGPPLVLPVTGEVIWEPVNSDVFSQVGPTWAIAQNSTHDLFVITSAGGERLVQVAAG